MLIRGKRGFEAFGIFIAELEHEIGFHCGKLYNGHTVKRKGDNWLLIIKASDATKPVVAFVEAQTHLDVWRVAYKLMYANQLNWREDKFNPRRG